MKTLVAVLALIWILTATAQASVTFTPPGSSKPMLGTTLAMTPSSEAKKLGSAAKVQVGMSKDQKTWMVDAHVTKGHKGGLCEIWLAGKATKMLCGPEKADANGNVTLSYTGSISPLGYKSVDVYYLPNDKATPGKGAVLMFSLETSKLKGKT